MHLGEKSKYISKYSAELLCPIPRKIKRNEIFVSNPLPFSGYDIWNAYEISWLNAKGKPEVAVAQFIIPANSENIIESKSFKLYLNSFNQTKFTAIIDVISTLKKDINNCTKANVEIIFFNLQNTCSSNFCKLQNNFAGICLDNLDLDFSVYNVCPEFLQTENSFVTETLYSNLLKSNCLVTGQPDWGSIQIQYEGKKINRAGLLRYIVSFREHNEFHEQCVERIFMDIMKICAPEKLCVYARYTRRGGLDINPIRYTHATEFLNQRLLRQ